VELTTWISKIDLIVKYTQSTHEILDLLLPIVFGNITLTARHFANGGTGHWVDEADLQESGGFSTANSVFQMRRHGNCPINRYISEIEDIRQVISYVRRHRCSQKRVRRSLRHFLRPSFHCTHRGSSGTRDVAIGFLRASSHRPYKFGHMLRTGEISRLLQCIRAGIHARYDS
jgi:hypothetical protein